MTFPRTIEMSSAGVKRPLATAGNIAALEIYIYEWAAKSRVNTPGGGGAGLHHGAVTPLGAPVGALGGPLGQLSTLRDGLWVPRGGPLGALRGCQGSL